MHQTDSGLYVPDPPKVNVVPSLPIGETIDTVRTPVYYSPFYGISQNRGCVTGITGSLGSGKTFVALLINLFHAVLGGMGLVIDPKVDFTSLLNKSLVEMFVREDELNRISMYNMAANDAAGALDPFIIKAREGTYAQWTFASSIIAILAGELEDTESRIVMNTIKDVYNTYPDYPSLSKVMDRLGRDARPEAQNVYTRLEQVRGVLPFANLLFVEGAEAKRRGRDVMLPRGLTVITLLGLNLPDAPTTKKSEPMHRVAAAIMHTLLSIAQDMIANPLYEPVAKLITIDESWAIASNDKGGELIKEVARLGRSRYAAMLTLSQNIFDIKGEEGNENDAQKGTKSSVSSRFAFGVEDADEAERVINDMRIPFSGAAGRLVKGNPGAFTKGQCLYRDVQGNVASVQINPYKPSLLQAFSTNPLEASKKKIEAAKARLEAQRQAALQQR